MPDSTSQIDHPASPYLAELCEQLSAQAIKCESPEDWPRESLSACAKYGVFRWFLPKEVGGFGWNAKEIAEGYLQLGAACLTTTFVITQWYAAVKRILASENDAFVSVRQQMLTPILEGDIHVTVGISHLTTSRRHLGRPALLAKTSEAGFVLNGLSPWVTSAAYADHLLIGATLENDEQILALVPTASAGVLVKPPQHLVALSASSTGPVEFEDVLVPSSRIVAGPCPNVLMSSAVSGSGGIQTSALALAVSHAAIQYVADQATRRSDLQEKSDQLIQQWQEARDLLFQMAEGEPVCSNETLRTKSNSLVLRSTQAALVAAKGAGFVQGHPVGRWCREALFFLVWSCPQAVQDANLCALVGLSE